MRIGGILLTVEGRGWTVGADGEEQEGHHAYGVISYDAMARTYRFDAFVKEGYQTRSAPEVSVNGFSWTIPAGPQAEIRFVARLSDDGRWMETGERCTADGCSQILDMSLARRQQARE